MTAKRVALAAAATICTVVACEFLVQALGLAPPIKVIEVSGDQCVYQRSGNPILGFELKENYRNASPDFVDSYERTNQYGLRGPDVEATKPAGIRRILLLGDSVVEGYGLAETDTISARLRGQYAKEEEAPGSSQDAAGKSTTEVLNFGVSAYCTLAEIELLATKGVQMAPDEVVLIFVENDFDNFNREAFPLGSIADRPAWAEWLFKTSHLFRMACIQLDLFQFRADTDPVQWNQEAIGDNNVTAGLQRFKQLALQYDFRPLIAIWPQFQDAAIEDVHWVPDSDQLIVEALAARHGIPAIRLSTFFKRHQKQTGVQNPRLVYSQGDRLHPSPRGAIVAAEAIHEILQYDNDLLDSVQTVAGPELERALAELSNSSPNYSRVYNRVADELVKQGDYKRAIAKYQDALKEDADNATTHNNLAIALERSGQSVVAEEHYRRAVELMPDFAEALFNLGNLLTQQASATNEAQDLFIRAIQQRPDFVAAHFALSRLLIRDGRIRAGEMGLRQVIQLDANHAAALELLGNELAKQGRYAEACSFLERFVNLSPGNAEALNNLGAMFASLGDRPKAEQYFRAAIAADANHPKAAVNLKNLIGTAAAEVTDDVAE